MKTAQNNSQFEILRLDNTSTASTNTSLETTTDKNLPAPGSSSVGDPVDDSTSTLPKPNDYDQPSTTSSTPTTTSNKTEKERCKTCKFFDAAVLGTYGAMIIALLALAYNLVRSAGTSK